MTQAEKETIEAFCRELALALRRITGRTVVIPPANLPKVVEEPDQTTDQSDKCGDIRPDNGQ